MQKKKTENKYLKYFLILFTTNSILTNQIFLYRESDYMMIMGFTEENFTPQNFTEVKLITPDQDKNSFSLEKNQSIQFDIPELTKAQFDFEGNCIMPIVYTYKKTINNDWTLKVDSENPNPEIKTKLKIRLILFGNFFFEYLSFNSKVYFNFESEKEKEKTRVRFKTQNFASYFQNVNGYIFCAKYEDSGENTFKVNAKWENKVNLVNNQPLLFTKNGTEIDINKLVVWILIIGILFILKMERLMLMF